MKINSVAITIGALLAGVLAGSIDAVPAVADEGFYKGKTLKMIVRSNPGGGYDFYGRLLARHMPKYIHGKPN